jgi:hypothetical protein
MAGRETVQVVFEGGPLDGRVRNIDAALTKFEPRGLPERGVYEPAWPGALRWRWRATG